MKNYIKSIMTAALLLVATGTWADNVTVTTQVDGQASTAGGTATVDRPDALGGEEVTITVKPEQGYYLEDITAIKTIAGTYAQTRAPGIDEPLTLTHASGDAIEGQTTYKFVMPETGVNGASYSVEVTVNFSQRTSITDDATVTATGTFTYSGKAIVPETITVKLVSSNTTLTKTTDYTLAFADNTNQGTATITATGVGKYAGTATGTFTINPKEVKNPVIKLSQTSFDYDGQEHMPTVTVYDVDGTTEIPESEYNVRYQKKVSDSGNSGSGETGTGETGTGETGTSTIGTGTSTDADASVNESTVSANLKDEGTYTVVVTDKKGGNYTIATATAEFEITPKQTIWLMIQEVNPKTFTYDGNPHSPQLRIGAATETNCSAKFVLPDTEYTIEYKYNNTKVEECIAPGAYTMVVMPKAGSQYTFDPTTAEFEILESDVKIDPAVTAPTPIENLVYNGNNQQLFNPGFTTGGTMKYSIDQVTYPDGTVKVLTGYNVYSTFSKFTHSLKDAGTYLIYYKVEGNESYNDVAAKSFTVTISQKEVKNPTINLSETSFYYDGQEHKPTVTVYDDLTKIPESEYNVSYQKKTSDSGNSSSGETGTSTIGTGTSTEISSADGSSASVETKETGTYIVTISDKKGGNYKISNATAEYEIIAVDISSIELTAKTNLVYNGNAQALIVPPAFIGNNLEYQIVSYYKSMDDYKNVIKTGGNGKQGITGATGAKGKGEQEEITYPTKWSSKIPEGKNAGVYQIFYRYILDGEDNFLGSIPVEIAPAQLIILTGSAGKTYDGEPLTNEESAITGLVEGEKVTVTVTGSQTDVGQSKNTFEIKWEGTNSDNYTISENLGTLTVETKEVKDPTIDLSQTSFKYDGQEHKPTVTVYDGTTEIPASEYNVAYQKKASDSGSTGSGEIKEPGTYIVTITDKEGGNYTLGTATAEFKIVEDENTDVVVPPTPIEGLVYNGQPQALVKAGSVSKLREMQYRLSSENAWSTEIPVATNAGEYEVEYWAQAINALAKDLTSGYVKVTIAPKELKEENFFIGSSKDKITNASLNPYPVVDSVTVVLIEGDQPIKLQEGTDYTFDYFGADNQWIAEDELYMDKNQNKSINLVVTGKGNYSGEVSRSFTNTSVFYSINEQTNTATITGLANSEATTVVIPSTVAANGRNYPVTSLKGLGIEFPGTRLIDLTDFNLKNLKENPLEIEGGALEGKKVKVLPETLAFFASNPSLRTNVENGQLYADLKADYYLQTFSCGIDITIPREKKITYVVGKDTVNLGTIHDITEYLKFYKCTVKENDGKDEVFVSSIHDQMKDGFRRKTSGGGSGGGSTVLATSLLYEANNGVLIACDTTSVINLIEQVDVASIADQVDLKSLATALGYGALVKYAPEAMLKQYVLNNSDLVKKKIKEQFRSTAATLVAQYTKDKPIATGDVKTYGLDNMLVPVTESTHFDATDEAGNTYYILYNGTFHKINDNIKTEVSACKAVLKVSGSLAKSRTLDITEGDDDTTVISAILAEGDGEARWYNLSGQRIEKPTKKGLYILNGHKVVIK